jgi:hypothetical protein
LGIHNINRCKVVVDLAKMYLFASLLDDMATAGEFYPILTKERKAEFGGEYGKNL